jgi:hypothetical protein
VTEKKKNKKKRKKKNSKYYPGADYVAPDKNEVFPRPGGDFVALGNNNKTDTLITAEGAVIWYILQAQEKI